MPNSQLNLRFAEPRVALSEFGTGLLVEAPRLAVGRQRRFGPSEPEPRANTDHTLEILRRLRETYPAQPLTLLWDGATYHRSQVVHDLAAELRITLVPLAGYSPDFMPVEALWRWLRQQVTGNYCHDSVAALRESITAFEAAINLDSAALARRLTCKNSLNLVEEELRFSKWN